jgi:hypothetical protein
MNVPQKGEIMTCYACRRGRVVVGMETGWAHASARCRTCPWKVYSEGMTRKRLVFLSQTHADMRGHQVTITHDAVETVLKPKVGQQLPLIDDLLLP